MSSLGDLLLGNIPEPEDVQERERPQEYDDNDNKQQHIDIKPKIRERSPSDISNDGSNSRFALKEQKVFPERIEKKEFEKFDDDRRSNASSTDDLVRELLDPNDRPRNVWHVVAEGTDQKSPDMFNNDQDSRDYPQDPIRDQHDDGVDGHISGNLDDKSPSHRNSANRDRDEERTRDKSMDRDLRKPGERSPRRSSKSRSGRDRDHHDRRRSRDRGGDRDRDRDRRRRSPDRHTKSRSKRSRYSDDEDDDRDYKRHRGSRSRRHGRRSRSRSASRDSSSRRRRYRSRSDSRSPSVKRDSKTILVMQLSPRVVTRDLEDFFEKIGRVKEVRLIMDSKTRRHKGIAYIEFESASSAMKALDLNGQKFQGLPLQIQSALSEKQGDYQPAASTSSYNGHHHSSSHTSSSHYTSSRSHHLPPNSYRVYMGGLNVGITDEMLRTIVEPFGMVHKVEVIKDRATGLSRGYAFVTFANAEDGQEAIRNLDGFELAGKCMRVSKSTEKSDR